MRTDALLASMGELISTHAGRPSGRQIDGFLLSRVDRTEPDYELTDPLVVVMAQGGKRLYFDQQVVEYAAGDCLAVTTSLPLSGHFVDVSPERPALAVGLRLHAGRIAPLLSRLPRPWTAGHSRAASGRGIATAPADEDLLDAVVRMLRLLEDGRDIEVLAPMIEREMLWRLLTGPLGPSIAQIGLDDSALAHISRSVSWLRAHLSARISVAQLAEVAGMSAATFHRHFRNVTGTTPLQYQKRLRLQEARSLLLLSGHDVTTVGELVGYHSPTQFNREYRRQFGAPPGRDARALRESSAAPAQGPAPGSEA